MYLQAKYKHELQRDSVVSEYLWIIAAYHLKDNARNGLPRYGDMIAPKRYEKSAKSSDKMVQDVIAKFCGKGG